MLETYSDVLTDIPGSMNTTQHVITLSDNKPVAAHQYSLPLHYEDAIKTEQTQLLNMGIIEYSDSPYLASILPALKCNGTLRLQSRLEKTKSSHADTAGTDAKPEKYVPKTFQS